MPDNRGLNARSLARLDNVFGAPCFLLSQSVNGAETEKLWDSNSPFNFRIVNAWGVMLRAGTSSDTVVVQRIRSGTTAAITDTADIAAQADKKIFDFSELDDDYWSISKGDTLQVVTTGGVTTSEMCQVYLLCVRT